MSTDNAHPHPDRLRPGPAGSGFVPRLGAYPADARYETVSAAEAVERIAAVGFDRADAEHMVTEYLARNTAEHGEPRGGWMIDPYDLADIAQRYEWVDHYRGETIADARERAAGYATDAARRAAEVDRDAEPGRAGRLDQEAALWAERAQPGASTDDTSSSTGTGYEQAGPPDAAREHDAEHATDDAGSVSAGLPDDEWWLEQDRAPLLSDVEETIDALRAAEAGDWSTAGTHYAVDPQASAEHNLHQLREELGHTQRVLDDFDADAGLPAWFERDDDTTTYRTATDSTTIDSADTAGPRSDEVGDTDGDGDGGPGGGVAAPDPVGPVAPVDSGAGGTPRAGDPADAYTEDELCDIIRADARGDDAEVDRIQDGRARPSSVLDVAEGELPTAEQAARSELVTSASWAIWARDLAIERGESDHAARFARDAREAMDAAEGAGITREQLAAELDYPGGAVELDGEHIDIGIDSGEALTAAQLTGLDAAFGTRGDDRDDVVHVHTAQERADVDSEPGIGWDDPYASGDVIELGPRGEAQIVETGPVDDAWWTKQSERGFTFTDTAPTSGDVRGSGDAEEDRRQQLNQWHHEQADDTDHTDSISVAGHDGANR